MLGSPACVAASMNTCYSRPAYNRNTEYIIPTSGPESATLNNEFKLGGGDLIGVMHPCSPSCSEGTMVGAPALNYFSK